MRQPLFDQLCPSCRSSGSFSDQKIRGIEGPAPTESGSASLDAGVALSTAGAGGMVLAPPLRRRTGSLPPIMSRPGRRTNSDCCDWVDRCRIEVPLSLRSRQGRRFCLHGRTRLVVTDFLKVRLGSAASCGKATVLVGGSCQPWFAGLFRFLC